MARTPHCGARPAWDRLATELAILQVSGRRGAIGPTARWIAFAIGLSLLWPADSASTQSLPSRGQDPFAGARVFASKGCAACHAPTAAGGQRAPVLSRIGSPRSFGDVASAMWNHRPHITGHMPELRVPQAQLDAGEAAALVAYLFAMNYFEAEGDARAGRRLFTEKRCVVCHQFQGTGGVVGPSLDPFGHQGSSIVLAAAMWNHGPQMAEAMRVRHIKRPTFRDTELRDLIAYLRSEAPPMLTGSLQVIPGSADAGRRIFAEKRCTDCHSGGGPGPDLGRPGRYRDLVQFAAAPVPCHSRPLRAVPETSSPTSLPKHAAQPQRLAALCPVAAVPTLVAPRPRASAPPHAATCLHMPLSAPRVSP